MNSRCSVVAISLVAAFTAVADDPPDSASLALRAEKAIRSGRYRDGIRLLTLAIELNSDDAAQRFDPWLGGRRITAEDLAHGKAELDQMLRDRPQMALFDVRDSELSAWASRQFGGELRGTRIRYSSALPGAGYHAADVVRIGAFSDVGRQWSKDFADLKNALQQFDQWFPQKWRPRRAR